MTEDKTNQTAIEESDEEPSNAVGYDVDEDSVDYDSGDASESESIVDLTTLKASDHEKNAMQVNEDIKRSLSTEASFSVSLAQSGFSVRIAPLTFRDITDITGQNVSDFQAKDLEYKVLYKKIIDFGAKDFHPDFDAFAKMTSIFDVDTLYFALFNVTYPTNNKYTITCPNKDCGKEIELSVNANSLIQTYNYEKIGALSKQIMDEATTIDKIKEFSLVLKPHIGVKAPVSKIVFGIKIPTIQDNLDLIRDCDELTDSRSVLETNIVNSIGEVYIPDGKDGYTKTTPSKRSVYGIVDKLDPGDVKVLRQHIVKIWMENNISYGLKDVECPYCGTKIEKVSIDIRRALFTHFQEAL